MEKEAQKLGPLTKAREWINRPTEKILSAVSPEYGELLQKMHEVDQQVRNIATGEDQKDGQSLKDLLKLAKTNFNRREYMIATKYLGQFHEQVGSIVEKLASLKSAVNIKHHEFLFSDVEPEHIKYLTEKLGPKFKGRKTKQPTKTAGVIKDWWDIVRGNQAGQRAAWERSFPKQSKDLKKQIANMITKSESLLSILLATLKGLGSYRAQRKLEDYLKLAAKFQQRYNQYDGLFSEFYNTYVAPFVEMQAEQMKPKEEPKEAPKEEQPIGKDWSPEKRQRYEEFKKKYEKPTEHPGPGYNPILALQEQIEEAKRKRQEEAKQVQSGESRQSFLPISPGIPQSPKPSSSIPIPLIQQREPKSSEPMEVSESDIITDNSPITEEGMQTPSIEQTKVSPKFVAPKERPILVSNHNDFISKLASLPEEPFVLATEIILYAEKIKEEDPEVSTQLMQLSQKLLKG